MMQRQQSTVKSFVLKLQLSPTWNYYREMDGGNVRRWQLLKLKLPMMNLSDLPCSAKLETMHWDLKDVRLQLPATAVFASLVDLSPEYVHLCDCGNSGHILARLLSSACFPSLQKLHLRKITFPKLDDYELLIKASALLELTMSSGRTTENSEPPVPPYRGLPPPSRDTWDLRL